MKYKAVLFDMDGTVLNTLGDLTYAMNHTLGLFSLPGIDEEEMKHFLGNGARYLVEHVLERCGRTDMTEELLPVYMEYYEKRGAVETAPYEGIIELFDRLSEAGAEPAIVSNKPDGAVQVLAKKFFKGYRAIGERPDVRRKPAPDMLLAMLGEMDCGRENAVYIGDSEVDVETAKAAGVPCIAVTWGFRAREELADCGAETIVDSTDELKKMLLGDADV